MPCLYISMNVSLEGIDVDPIFSDATKAVAQITRMPQSFVMVVLKGGIAIKFGGSKEPAAFAEIVAMAAINSRLKRDLIVAISAILHQHLSIPTTRFFLKVTHAPSLSKI